MGATHAIVETLPGMNYNYWQKRYMEMENRGKDMTVREVLAASIKDIRMKIQEHERLLEHFNETGQPGMPEMHLMNYRIDQRLKKVILEAIEILENSRKAFKSKELETLRKKLIRVLAEDTQL